MWMNHLRYEVQKLPCGGGGGCWYSQDVVHVGHNNNSLAIHLYIVLPPVQVVFSERFGFFPVRLFVGQPTVIHCLFSVLFLFVLSKWDIILYHSLFWLSFFLFYIYIYIFWLSIYPYKTCVCGSFSGRFIEATEHLALPKGENPVLSTCKRCTLNDGEWRKTKINSSWCLSKECKTG